MSVEDVRMAADVLRGALLLMPDLWRTCDCRELETNSLASNLCCDIEGVSVRSDQPPPQCPGGGLR